MNVPNGRLKGKNAIGPYWSQGLASAPNHHFDLEGVLVGVNSVAILYRSVTAGRTVIDLIEVDDDRKVIRAQALLPR